MAATNLYSAFMTFRGLRHKLVQDLHSKYGPVVRINPNLLSFIDEAAWRDIFVLRQGGKQMQKAFNGLPVNGAFHIINAPDDVHSRQRRVLAQAFSEKAVCRLDLTWDGLLRLTRSYSCVSKSRFCNIT